MLCSGTSRKSMLESDGFCIRIKVFPRLYNLNVKMTAEDFEGDVTNPIFL